MSEPRAAVPAVPVIAHTLAELRRGLATLCPELRGRALRLARDAALADDLVQETVVRALRFEGQYRFGTNLRAWAYQILFSVFVTRYRRARRERNALRHLASDLDAWPHHEPFTSPERAGGLTRSTAEQLSALPPAFREVIVRVDLGDATYREAAAELGVPLGTVMSRLHRGRRLLADAMQAAPGGHEGPTRAAKPAPAARAA
ncbi:MAG TPA: sigma-70 family RNA polymerase sigma factor [Polyangiaceae bacterium]|nr:sigma-70 family RNA polymerase sigma factor [Polyangiaceae bacterium]